MALILNDRVKETSATTGTGSLTLGGAGSGYQTFQAGIGNGNTTYYAIVDSASPPTYWEVGTGTYTSLTDTLSRDTVYSSSNGNAKVDIPPASVSFVFCDLPASQAATVAYADTKNIYVYSASQTPSVLSTLALAAPVSSTTLRVLGNQMANVPDGTVVKFADAQLYTASSATFDGATTAFNISPALTVGTGNQPAGATLNYYAPGTLQLTQKFAAGTGIGFSTTGTTTTITNTNSGGGLTDVVLNEPAWRNVNKSTVNNVETLTVTDNAQNGNTVFAGSFTNNIGAETTSGSANPDASAGATITFSINTSTVSLPGFNAGTYSIADPLDLASIIQRDDFKSQFFGPAASRLWTFAIDTFGVMSFAYLGKDNFLASNTAPNPTINMVFGGTWTTLSLTNYFFPLSITTSGVPSFRTLNSLDIYPAVSGTPAQGQVPTYDAGTKNLVWGTGSGGALITSPQNTIVVGGTTSNPTLDVAIPAETTRIDGRIATNIGSATLRTQLSNGTEVVLVVISQVSAQPVQMVITTRTDSTAILATLNAAGANATTISNRQTGSNTLLVQSWAANVFQIVATFPPATTLAQVQALFSGARSDSVYYGGPTTGQFTFVDAPKQAIANQFVAGSNITLTQDANRNVTIASTGGSGGVQALPFDVVSWTNNSGVSYVSDITVPQQTVSIKALTALNATWEFTGTVTIPGFTDGKELVGSDGLGRTLSGVYTAGTGGTNYATLTQVNYERSSGFVVGTLYSMIWRQGKLAAAALYVGDTVGSAQLASELGGTSSISFTADTLNAGRYLVSVPNAYVKGIADAEDAANIGSLSTNPVEPFAQLGGTVVTDTSNWVGTAANIATASYTVARNALIALGATPNVQPAGGLWTLPAAPLFVTNIANPTNLQYARIASIDEGVSTQLLILNITAANTYLDSLPTGSTPVFITKGAFVFQSDPLAAIQRNTVASLNALQGPVTLTAGTGIGISTGTNNITVTNTGSGTSGSGNALVFTNNSFGEALITEAATESLYVEIGYTSSLEIGSGGSLGGVTYFDTTNAAPTGAGLGIRTKVATNYTSLNPVFYTSAYQVVFTTPAGALATDYSLDNLLFAKKTPTGNIYANANLWPPLRDANPSDDIQLIPVKTPTFSIVSSGANQWTASIGEGIWDASFSGYNWLAADLSIEYVAYLRIFENSGVSRPPTGVSITRTSGLGGIRLLASLPGTSGATPTLSQVLTVGNQTGAGRSIIYQDSQATPNSVTLSAPAAVTTSYALKLPAAQATAAGQVLANDGSGNLSWGTSSGGTNIWDELPFKTNPTNSPDPNTMRIYYLGPDTLALVTAQQYFPVGQTFTLDSFVAAGRRVKTVVSAVTSPSANIFDLQITAGTIEPYQANVGVVRVNQNQANIEFDFPIAYQVSNSKIGLSLDNSLGLSSVNGRLGLARQAATDGQGLSYSTASSAWVPTNFAGNWLTGSGTPADSLGQIGSYYQDTSVTPNKFWLKTQTATSPYWAEQTNFENAVRSYVGGALTFGFSRVVALTNITLSGTQTIDGIAVAVGDIVLAAGQTLAANNGLWTVASGAWTRPTTPVMTQGLVILVSQGTSSGGSSYVETAPITNVGTSAQVWNLFTAQGGAPTLQAVTLNGNTTTTSITASSFTANGLTGAGTLSLTAIAGAALISTTGSDSITLSPGTSGGLILGNSNNSALTIANGATANLAIGVASGNTNTNITLSSKGATSVVNIGNASAGYMQVQGNPATSPVQIIVAGTTNQALLLSPAGNGNTFIGNAGSFSGITLTGGLTTIAELTANATAANVNLNLKAKGAGSVSIGSSDSTLPGVIFSGAAAGPSQIVASSSNAAMSLQLVQKGTGDVIIGDTVSYAGLKLMGGLSSYVKLQPTNASGNADFVIQPAGTGNFYPIGNTISATASLQAKTILPDSKGSQNLGTGAINQVYTSNGGSGSSFWGHPLISGSMTVYTGAASPTGSGVGALSLTTQFNNLGLTMATNQVSGFVANGVYLIDVTFGYLPTTAAALNNYLSFSTTPNILTAATYGAGVAVSNIRPASTPNGDYSVVSARGIYAAGATPANMYAYYFAGAAGTIGSTTIIITRIA